MNCLLCEKETSNPKYCSRSCAAKKNNRDSPKRKRKEHHCERCGCSIRIKRKYCKPCREITRKKYYTLKEAKVPYSSYAPSAAHNIVRGRARTALFSSGRNVCENCGYKEHVECAHRKAIHTFDDDTLISEINHLDNLVALCPNCHWEYDNGKLSL